MHFPNTDPLQTLPLLSAYSHVNQPLQMEKHCMYTCTFTVPGYLVYEERYVKHIDPCMYVVTGFQIHLKGQKFLSLEVKKLKHHQTFRPLPG